MPDSGPDQLTLADEFPPATREQWLRLVTGVLKGAAFDEKLVSTTYDGLRIEPLYARAPRARPIAGRAAGHAWEVLQRVDHPNPAQANAQALHDLENGADGLSIVFAGSPGAHGYGIEASEAALDRALEGVRLDGGVALELQTSAEFASAASAIAAVARRSGIEPRAIDLRFGLDPIGTAAVEGFSAGVQEIGSDLGRAVAELVEHGFKGPFAVADARVIHDAGGSEAQELAYALAAAIMYLRMFEHGGAPPEKARGLIFFRLAADADQFLTVAKFRALRKLWARVEEACGLESAPAFVSAETAWRMMAKRDPHVNMLRTTVAALAAGIGGADAISDLPFTAALGLPDRFARRVARNTQLVLLQESNLAKVADPAAGSGGIEDLTQKLCAAAWTLMQDIEKSGGLWAALEHGAIQAEVAAVRASRVHALAHRKDALTGTSDFPALDEAPVSVLEVAPVGPVPARPITQFAPLRPMRLGEPFEALRDVSDRALAATGARPKVFLANLGIPSAFTARATFATNFFAVGGIETLANEGFAAPGASSAEARTDLDALADAFKASGARIACLCSSDDVYEREGAAAAQALAAAGATHIYLVGRPGERSKALEDAGVQTFVYAGCDVLGVLQQTHAILGIA